MRLPTLAVATFCLLTLAQAEDARLGPLKDLNGYFPFPAPKSVQAWKPRQEFVRRQLLVSQGLWPMPTKTPLNAVIGLTHLQRLEAESIHVMREVVIMEQVMVHIELVRSSEIAQNARYYRFGIAMELQMFRQVLRMIGAVTTSIAIEQDICLLKK